MDGIILFKNLHLLIIIPIILFIIFIILIK